MNNDSERKQLDGTGASIEQDMGGHPLFPRPETETGPDPRRFDLIRIYRYLPDGSKETCPRVWKGSELRSVEQVVELYGGGKYQFQATCGSTHRIQAYSEYFYCAEPARKPFHNDVKPPGETAPPPPPPPPPSPAVDMTALIKLLLERESRAAEAQVKMQETLLRLALEKPAPPNAYEGFREALQLVQSMNTHQGAANTDPVKMLERGIAMGKDLASGDAGAGEEKIPWGGLVEAATVGLSLLRKKQEKEDAKPAKAEEKPKSESPKPELPAPQAATLPQIMFDPATGMPYTFIAGLGFVRLDPAVVFAQMYGHRPPPAPPQYPYAQPPVAQHQMPSMPVAPPYASMPVSPAPPAPMPQHAPIPAPPQTMPIAQPVAPLPRPVAPPVPPAPPPSPVPPTVRSARLHANALPAQPANVPNAPTRPRAPVMASPQQSPPNVALRQTTPRVPPASPAVHMSGVPPTSKSNGMVVHNDATDELWEDLPELGDDFAQVVNDGLNSPMAQQIMQDPRYLALRDAVVKGEMSVGDVNDEFVHLVFGAKGGGS